MTKIETTNSMMCFVFIVLGTIGAICLLIGSVEHAIYCNTFVVALQSTLIGQRIILRDRNSKD